MIVLLMLTVPIRAAQESLLAEETQRLLDQLDTSSLQQAAQEIEFDRILRQAAAGESALDPQRLLNRAKDLMADAFAAVLPGMLRIAGLGILSSGMTQLVLQKEAAKHCETMGVLCTGLMLSSQIAELFSVAEQVMQRLTDFTEALLPTLLAILTACGGTHSAAGLKRISLAAASGISGLGQDVLLTILGCSAALVLISAAMDEGMLKGACRTLRSAVHWLLGASCAVFLGCLAVQGGVSAHYDSVALRVARYAADKSIPVVGGMFKDASDTLIGCALIVKNSLGTAGLAALLAMLMQPLVQIVCMVFSLKLCAAALDLFGAGRICNQMQGFAEILQTLMIVVLSAGAMSLMIISALMYTGMGFI